MNHHLHKLGLSPRQLSKDTACGYRVVKQVPPGGIGVCRAYAVTEAAWPEGAELCVIVEWSPDLPLRRYRDGTIPDGAEDHWRERITATADALESVGYVVEPSPFHASPRFHPYAELVVYRMSAGVAPGRVAADQEWALTEPVPPHDEQPFWPDPEQSPVAIVEAALREAGLGAAGAYGDLPDGWVTVRSITQSVWPHRADLCAWVIWRPAGQFARDPGTGTVPAGAADHWRQSLDRLARGMRKAGFDYRTRTHTRPWDPFTDEEVHLLVYRTRSLP